MTWQIALAILSAVTINLVGVAFMIATFRATTQADISYLKVGVDKLVDAIEGNGKTGLKTEVALLKKEISLLQENEIVFLKNEIKELRGKVA